MAILNLPEISTGEVVKINSDYIIKMLRSGVECKDIRASIFFGPTGVGKSAAIYQIAERLRKELKRPVEVVDIRLTTCSITDLIGIPVPNADRTETTWLRPEIFKINKSEDDDTLFLYFFDELDKASPSVQAAALQLVLDRTAFSHNFSKNTIIFAAANPARTSSAKKADGMGPKETKMTPELLNRFRQFLVKPDMDSFREWAIANKLHPLVLGYLSFDNSKLYAASEMETTAFPTPRSWKSVSDLLKAYDGPDDMDISDLHYDIAGDLGKGVALEFESWCSVSEFLPDIRYIFTGQETKLPRTPDVLHAVIASMTTYIEDHIKRMPVSEMRNACKFVNRFPVDFAALFYRNIRDIEGVNLRLMKVTEYSEWCRKHSEIAGR
ncbi:MAG: AAA family ATPase [Eubacterium sp.]|nr:AAA family ATPase [Eubacterium sp.]